MSALEPIVAVKKVNLGSEAKVSNRSKMADVGYLLECDWNELSDKNRRHDNFAHCCRGGLAADATARHCPDMGDGLCLSR